MKFKKYLNENFNNWVRYTDESLKSDWEEFKKKEFSKWENRAKMLNSKWPLFEDFKDFKLSLDKAKIVTLTNDLLNKIEHATNFHDLQKLTDMVKSYKRPRNIERIIEGFKNNNKIPMSIILKSNNKYFIMAGNTRQNTARILNIKPKVLIVDVSK
jgi:hypothetical protein